ncbi:MAG: lysophospholipid acyltransferase family protein [Mesorhizobium sp.]
MFPRWFRNMGRNLTVLARNLAFYLAVGLMSIAFAPVVLMAILRIASWDFVGRAYLACFGWLLRRICGIAVEVTGMENIPAGQVLFACAQQCNWENFFIPPMVGNPVIFIKNELQSYPIMSQIARERGYIFANRGQGLDAIRDTFAQARARKADGHSLFIFPTGWRTGEELSPPFQHGIARLYTTLDMPCVPIAHNAVRCWPHKSWLRLPGTIRVHILPPIEPGLDKASFLNRLHGELFGATDDLLSPPAPPALYHEPDSGGRALARDMMDGAR